MENRLKPETTPVITELTQSNIRTGATRSSIGSLNSLDCGLRYLVVNVVCDMM